MAPRAIAVRELTETDVAQIGDRLPLHRLGAYETYLVAWDGEEPVGHAHISWTKTRLGLPEIQDVFVPEHLRRQGVATALALAAEEAASERGHERISLSYGITNEAAKLLYEGLGYRNAGLEPERVSGVIELRGRIVEVDDTLVYLVKDL